MSGAINFYRNKRGDGARLHIGWRKRGYAPVWYEPLSNGEKGDKLRTDIGLFANPTGDATDKEPMPGEVIWHPWYDTTKGETSNPRERAIIHKQDLEDFYGYLMEKNEERVARREEELDDPGNMRRYAFLQEARKWKRKDMRARRKRRSRREGVADAAGVGLGDLDINSDSSDDSGVEMEEQERSRAKKRREMPPPPRPSGSNKRRKGNGADAGGGKRKTNSANRARDSADDLFYPALASGGLGVRDSQSYGGLDRAGSVDLLNGRYRSDGSLDYDPRTPERGSGSPMGTRVDSPVGVRNYVHPTVETATNDSGDPETQARHRGVAGLNGEGTDEDAEFERGLRESTAVARQGPSEELNAYGLDFGNGYDGLSGILPTPNTQGSRHRGRPNSTTSTRRTPGNNSARQTGASWEAENAGLDDDAALERGVSASLGPDVSRNAADEQRSAREPTTNGPFQTDEGEENGTTGQDSEGGENGGDDAEGDPEDENPKGEDE